MLGFCQAAENNKVVIFKVLHEKLKTKQNVVEIGSGSGQHALFFTHMMPHLTWQCSETGHNISNLVKNINHADNLCLPEPLVLDVCQKNWPQIKTQVIFTANTFHIISDHAISCFFEKIAKCLSCHGLVFIYGPFKYLGEFTTQSNARFNSWLKSQDIKSGIKDIEKVIELANQHHLNLIEDNDMPANNQLLVFEKTV